MSLTFLGLDELVVNRNNDRHGELTDEASAIRWLLDNREQHMKSLANDIATQKKIYEPPLVSKEHDKYLVFDGNRRVTCLKVLHEPRLAPTQSLRDFFYNLQKRHGGKFPNEIECKIENDRSTIDEILFRRHTGSQSGVGQSQWDDSAKHNFIVRTGQKPGKNVAEGIERKLLKTGHLASENTLPRSNLNRLLSSEEFRNQVGISLAGSKLYFTATPEKVLMALNRIASDLISKRLVLGHIWNNEGKRDYLSELKDQGLLPSSGDALRSPIAFNDAPESPKVRPKPATHPPLASGPRSTLIPTDIEFAINWNPMTIRIAEVWKELQQLKMERYPNSVAVSLRVLLELSVDNYIACTLIARISEYDLLRKKVEAAANSLAERGIISEKYKKDLQRFATSETIISTAAMHRYVHALQYSPSPRHLTAIWDTISEFLVHCINAKLSRQAA